MKNLVKFLPLTVLLLGSCSNKTLISNQNADHYDPDTYLVAGGFDSEVSGTTTNTGPRAGQGSLNEPSGSSRGESVRGDRLGNTYRGEDREDPVGTGYAQELYDDEGLGMGIGDYRRAYRQGYRDGQWDQWSYPGLYRPNYGGWGWGIGPGIGWNAPCWSWGGGWNYFSVWNNPWNSWYQPWGPAWGGGWYGGWYGGWNHWNRWNSWGGWGGNAWAWTFVPTRSMSGPRRSRMNQLHVRAGRGPRVTPWGMASSNGAPRTFREFRTRLSQNPRSTREAAIASSGATQGATARTRRFGMPYAQDRAVRPVQREQRTVERAYGSTSDRSVWGSERARSWSDRRSMSVERQPSRSDRTEIPAERSGSEFRATYRSRYSDANPWSEKGRTEYEQPNRSPRSPGSSSYSSPRSSYSSPRSSYSSPRSSGSSSYSSPRSSGSTPSSSGSRPSSSFSSPSSGGRSGSHTPRR